MRLVKLAMVDGFALDQTAVKDSWQHYLGDFLHGHLKQQQLFHNFDIASVIERAKHQHAFEYFAVVQHSSLMLYSRVVKGDISVPLLCCRDATSFVRSTDSQIKLSLTHCRTGFPTYMLVVIMTTLLHTRCLNLL